MSGQGLPLLRKVFAILPVVQNHQGISVAELSRLTGLSEQEIVKELPSLVNLCGLPPYSPADLVDLSVEGDRVSIRFADQFRRPIRLTLREALALEMALAGWDREREGPFRSAVRSIRSKVRAGCLPDVARQVETAAGRIEAEPPLGLAARIVGLAKEAMGRLREVEMEYFSRSRGRLGRRRVLPYGIYEQGGHWYVVAFEEAAGGIRTFRADRVREARLTERGYEIPADFDVGQYRREGPPAPEEGARAVTIVFGEAAARFALEAFPAGEKRTRPSGDLEVVVRTTGPAWILSCLLRWGGAAVVEGPADVRSALCARARETLAVYGR